MFTLIHRTSEKEWLEIMKTRVTEIFGIKYPIVQGGLGQITAATLRSPEKLREEIRKVHTLTTKPFAVNFAIARHDGQYLKLLLKKRCLQFLLQVLIHNQFLNV